MTFRGIANDIWQLISSSVYVLYNFAVYKCDQESLYVTIYLGYLLSAIYSKLPPVCLAKLSRPVSDHTNLACKLAGHRLRDTQYYNGLEYAYVTKTFLAQPVVLQLIQ